MCSKKEGSHLTSFFFVLKILYAAVDPAIVKYFKQGKSGAVTLAGSTRINYINASQLIIEGLMCMTEEGYAGTGLLGCIHQ